jgi:lycopene beta-cyclase
MRNNYDLIILGGGCAGLSLAMRLSAQGTQCPRVLILERREHYENDRTWCFWDTEHTFLKGLTQKRWQKIEIKTAQAVTIVDVKHTPYQMLPAEIFYKAALDTISKNNKITLQYNAVVSAMPVQVDACWQLEVGGEHYSALSIVDTRPQKIPKTGDAVLWQSFYGHEIVCEHEVFDQDLATLMDFDQSDPSLICFCYVLPISTTRALIEITVFAPNPMRADELNDKLKAAIERYTEQRSYQIIRSEQGVLPMGNGPILANVNQSYVHAGLFAGAARPSTGFAFQRIQRWSELCASSILQTQRPVAHPADSRLQLTMDGLFLQVLRAQPQLAPSIFFKLFFNCDRAIIVRFLSDQAQLSDYLAIVLALPAWPFLKQLPQYLTQKLSRYVTQKLH